MKFFIRLLVFSGYIFNSAQDNILVTEEYISCLIQIFPFSKEELADGFAGSSLDSAECYVQC